MLLELRDDWVRALFLLYAVRVCGLLLLLLLSLLILEILDFLIVSIFLGFDCLRDSSLRLPLRES